jgi:6-phosphogluconolactonase
MAGRSQRWPIIVLIGAFCAMWGGCGSNKQTVCATPANSSLCTCGGGCPIQAQPVLFATTTSDQILGFSIAPSGALTSLASVSGPANSQSIAGMNGAIFFADAPDNQVAGASWNIPSGTITAAQGSPFSLGTGSGGPTSLLFDNELNLYATEPNGTIIGYSTPGNGTLSTPLPGSPYSAGVTPAQMAFAQLNSGAALYASDPGDSIGGILAFSVNSDGSLSPLSGSPFSTVAGASPSFLLWVTDTSENQFLFASLSNAGQVAAFSIDTSTGALTAVSGSPFTVGNGPDTLAEVVVNGSSELLVMNTVDHTVAAFTISSTGSLAPLGSPVPVGTASGGMAIYGDGNEVNGVTYGPLVYTADTAASAIETVNVNDSTGALSAGTVVSTSLPPVQLIQPSP